MAGEIRYTTDHDVIRRWVEERGGWPAKFLKIYFPAYVMRGAFPRIDWEEFFQTFEARRLVFLYQTQTPDGERSHFFRFVQRRAWRQAAGVGSPDLVGSSAARHAVGSR